MSVSPSTNWTQWQHPSQSYCECWINTSKDWYTETSLVVQQLRFCLQMQGRQIWFLVMELVSHIPKPMSCTHWALKLWSLCLATRESLHLNEKPAQPKFKKTTTKNKDWYIKSTVQERLLILLKEETTQTRATDHHHFSTDMYSQRKSFFPEVTHIWTVWLMLRVQAGASRFFKRSREAHQSCGQADGRRNEPWVWFKSLLGTTVKDKGWKRQPRALLMENSSRLLFCFTL